MKREEIEEMLEQVKDEYVQEAMPGAETADTEGVRSKKLCHRKQKKLFVCLTGAAVLALLCLGAYRMGGRRISLPEEARQMAKADSDESQESGNPSESENEKTEPASGQSSEQGQEETASGIDYSIYFQEEFPSDMIAADYTLEAGGHRYEYKGEPAAEPLGIDPGVFSEAEATVYCDPDGTPVNLLFYLSNQTDGEYLSLACSEKGTLFSCFPIEEANGVEYQGVMVYGYHHPYPEHTSDPWSLELYFRRDGVGYSLSSSGMTYDEVGAVMASIFAAGFRPSSYDPGRGEECYRTLETISFEQANEVFENNVPALEQVAGMNLEEGCRYFVSYRDGRVESRLLDLCYSSSNAYLMVSYRTAPYGTELENVIPASEVNRESAARYGSENDEPGFNWYSFTIEYEDYAIDITARCTEEMLWEYLGKMEK